MINLVKSHSMFLISVAAVVIFLSILSINIAIAQENATDPCAGITCNTPPPNECTDTTGAKIYYAQGTCSAGQCSYSFYLKSCGTKSQTCPDGFAVECKNTCSAGNCLDCTPDCSGHQVTDKCAGVTCSPFTLTCLDKFVASCTPKCDSATGACGTCTPDCSGHMGSNATSVCNNWVREEMEQCDGSDLAGQTCQSRGFAGGTLKCNMGCTFDTSGCTSTTTVCGNGMCESGEYYDICPSDCPKPIPTIVCGNKICESGENYDNCIVDCPKPSVCPTKIVVIFDKQLYKLGDRGTMTVSVYGPDGSTMSSIKFILKGYVNGKLTAESSAYTPYTSSGSVSASNSPGDYITDVYTDVPNCPSVSGSAKVVFETGGTCGDKICGYGESYSSCPSDCIAPVTPPSICIMVITPAKNPLTGECKEFGTPCDVPAGWEKVTSCGTGGGGVCPLYTEPPCPDGYKVSGGLDPNGCKMPVTCCGDKICSGKENEMNCKNDCVGGGTLNCANVVICLSGDGCCPPGCSSQDKDCGGQLPTGQRCPDGTEVKCGYVGESYRCDPCPIPVQNIQENCWQEKDPATGTVRMICNKICPEQQEVIDTQMSAAKQKCIEHNGRPVQRVDGRGCNYIDCEFGTTGPTSPISINPVYCPSPQQIEDTIMKCKSMGIEPLYSFESGCKVVKCEERKREGCDYLPEEEWTRMKAICNPKGLAAIKEYDRDGCQIIRCAATGECPKDPPPEAFEKCRAEGGEMIINRDPNGCAFSRCIMRGDERDVYVEDITEMPESTELLSIAFKLEELKMELDKLAQKTDDIANYYQSTNSPEEQRFRRVSDMFEAAKDKVDEIKTTLRNKLQTLMKDDLMQIKRDIRYIKDVMLKDIVYVMLSNSDEVKSMIQKPRVGYTEKAVAENDCGTDGMCFDRAFRVCKPVTFRPTGPPPGQEEQGPPEGEEPDIYITGLEGDTCVIKIVMREGTGPPPGVIPGINPPYEMKCKFSNYALGAQQMASGPESFKKYCEGNLLQLMSMGPQAGGGSAQGEPVVPGVCSGNMDCARQCPASAENAKKCLDVLGKYNIPLVVRQIFEDIASGRMKPDPNIIVSTMQTAEQQPAPRQRAVCGNNLCENGPAYENPEDSYNCPSDCMASTSAGGGGAVPSTTTTTTKPGPCAGCLNNGICDIGECRDCQDCYGR